MLKKPTKKSLVEQGTTVGSAIVGGAVSDGVVGLVPEEYKKWGKPAFALACAIASASVKSNTTSGKILQGAFAGMSIKQGLDYLRELIGGQMSAKEGDSQFAKFTNNVLGLAGTEIHTPNLVMDASMFQRNRSALASTVQKEPATSSKNMIA